MDTEIMFQHGWAFDANTWQSWIKILTKDGNARALSGERGYFGAERVTPSFSANAKNRIVIAHSFGAHLLPAETWRQADTAVLVNSFISLKRNARVIRAMLKKFSTDSDHVVLDFWRNCYTPEAAGLSILPPPGMSGAALEQDLVTMQESTLDIEALCAIPNVVLINSSADHIVSKESQRDLVSALPNARTIELTGGCHAAHLTQAFTCLQMITHWSHRNQVETCQTQKS